ncbi:hypothetical protein SK128_003352, partial [Halocaridina rubra]
NEVTDQDNQIPIVTASIELHTAGALSSPLVKKIEVDSCNPEPTSSFVAEPMPVNPAQETQRAVTDPTPSEAKTLPPPTKSHQKPSTAYTTNVINNKNKNKETTISNVADWPTLVEVQQAQEAIHSLQNSKSEWRKSEERKLKNGEKDNVDKENEKSEDSGSHDDDSLKENREASAPQTKNNKKQQSNNSSTKEAKNKKNKIKKQNWKPLDIQPPKREKGFRRSDGRASDSIDWRADSRTVGNISRGRGGNRGGNVRGRGRGRGRGLGSGGQGRGAFRSTSTEPFENYLDYAEAPSIGVG